MQKIKNSKTLTKRIKNITKNGSVLFRKMSAQHRMHGKNKKIKSRSKQSRIITSADYKRLKKLIPNK
jgi:ribosomal protein L35